MYGKVGDSERPEVFFLGVFCLCFIDECQKNTSGRKSLEMVGKDEWW